MLMKNKYAICEWYLSAKGLSAIKTAASMGYEGIQLSDLDGLTQNFPLTDIRLQEDYLEAASKYNITFQCLLAQSMIPQGGLKEPLSEPSGETAFLIFKKAIEVCVALNIKTCLVASFLNNQFKSDYEMKNTIDNLKLFVEYAENKGIQVVYEPFCTTEKTLHILDKIPNLQLCYDTLNPLRFGYANPPDEIKRIGIERIDHVHVKDAPENMVGCWPLGEGSGLVAESISVLKELGYEGWYVEENYVYLSPMNSLGAGIDLAKKDLEFLQRVCE